MIFITSLLYTDLSEETSLLYLTIVYAVRMFGLSLVMMPVTTAGINVLPRQLIPHGTAMNNTMRQVSGSIGTAILVSIMTASAGTQNNEAMIQGVNNAFIVAAVVAFLSLILSFFIKKNTKHDIESD